MLTMHVMLLHIATRSTCHGVVATVAVAWFQVVVSELLPHWWSVRPLGNPPSELRSPTGVPGLLLRVRAFSEHPVEAVERVT